MYPNNYFMGKDLYRSQLYEGNPYYWYPYSSAHSNPYKRGETIQGQATWTEGGQVTKCGIPWSENEYMTVAVGEDAPYKCGQTIKLTNFSQAVPREVLVTVVDEVQGILQIKLIYIARHLKHWVQTRASVSSMFKLNRSRS